MESDKCRRVIVMSRRPVARFSPMLENNSRNILASGELKSENLSRNLRVTWLFREWWDRSWDSKRRGARSEKEFTTDYADGLVLRVRDVATWVKTVVNAGRISDTSYKSERNARKHVVTWIGTWTGLRTRVYVRLRLRWASDAFFLGREPRLSPLSFTGICALWSQTR